MSTGSDPHAAPSAAPVSAPAAPSAPAPATPPAKHGTGHLYEEVEGLLDWTKHTAQEIEHFFAGLSAQQVINLIPPSMYAEIAKKLPPALEAGIVSLASVLGSGELSVLANWLGTNDFSFVMLFLDRIAAPGQTVTRVPPTQLSSAAASVPPSAAPAPTVEAPPAAH